MEVMIDLETASTRGDAAILVLAAIKFRRWQNIGEKCPINTPECFYRKIDLDSCVKIGLRKDQETLDFWEKQPAEIRAEAFDGVREDIKSVLADFSEFYKGCICIWSNGATFDIPILAEAYARLGSRTPWEYYQARDTRTIYDLGKVSSKDFPKDNPHHALYDCWRQIVGVQKAFSRLKIVF